MKRPVRSLPVVQNWDCQGCTNCCRDYEVTVTEEERQRILGQGWDADPEMQGVPLIDRQGWLKPHYALHHRPDGACVFLNEKGGCRIHAKFGSQAKPLACRIYPFLLIPTGDHWRVGMRFACPSVVKNEGKPLARHREELQDYATALEKREGIAGTVLAAPALQAKDSATWTDLLQFVKLFLQIISDSAHPLEWRMRKGLALIGLCRAASFGKVTGDRLREFLEIIEAGLDSEVPVKPQDVPPPGWTGRILFRQLIALYARKDSGPDRGIAQRGRLALLWAAWRFACGTKRIPRVHRLMPEATFEAIEAAQGPLPAEAEKLLTRYYQVKIESVQFCGPTNFARDLFDGFESLAMTLPSILWLFRLFRLTKTVEESITLAIRMVDDNFGFNPLLGTKRQLFAFWLLRRNDEISRLIAWYSR